MRFSSPAIVLALRSHGEVGGIVRLMTPEHGLQACYVRGARGRRMRPVLMAGNVVAARLSARSEAQLAQAEVELVHSRAPLLGEPLPAAAIEQNHDDRGIIWPDAIAPFTVVVCPIGMDRSADVKAAAEKLHDELIASGVDVLLDDRGERPGAMFAD